MIRMPASYTTPEILNKLAEALPALRKSSDQVPAEWDDYVQRAVQLKRAGHYDEASALYLRITLESGTLYTGIMLSWYKTVVTAGYLSDAQGLLGVGDQIYDESPPKFPAGLVIPDWTSSFVEHSIELKDAAGSLPTLEAYLRPLSGNPNYRFPRSYSIELGRLKGLHAEVERRKSVSNALNAPSTSGNPTSGCYIATAVYGSYDAPQVISLRKFRDQRLARTTFGRALILGYYALSPRLTKLMMPETVLNRLTRRVLDRVVSRVDRMELVERMPT